MTDRPRIDRLFRAVSNMAASAEAYSGHCFRFVKPKYGNRLDAFSGAGSQKASGRFHVRGKFIVVYTSVDLETAQWEYFHTARTSGFQPADLLPCTAISANVTLSKVLNLTSSIVRQTLKVTLKELRTLTWDGSLEETMTQKLGRLAYESGCEALLVPSAGGGRNLNIFRQNLLVGSAIEIINEDELVGS